MGSISFPFCLGGALQHGGIETFKSRKVQHHKTGQAVGGRGCPRSRHSPTSYLKKLTRFWRSLSLRMPSRLSQFKPKVKGPFQQRGWDGSKAPPASYLFIFLKRFSRKVVWSSSLPGHVCNNALVPRKPSERGSLSPHHSTEGRRKLLLILKFQWPRRGKPLVKRGLVSSPLLLRKRKT